MRLSAELYQQIVAALKSDSQRDKDKRREPRVGMAGEADLITVDETGKRIAGQVRVRDVSASGVGLFFSQPLAKGQRFVLQLQSAKGERIWLVCHTAYSRKIEGNRYSVGARIKQLMRDDQIQHVERQSTAMSATTKLEPGPASSDVERISKAILG